MKMVVQELRRFGVKKEQYRVDKSSIKGSREEEVTLKAVIESIPAR